MRDIDDYSKKYTEDGFESYQVAYRRKKILEVLKQYTPESVLEIGCGYEPLFEYYNKAKFTIVEPSEMFVRNAESLGANREEVIIIKGFFEDVSAELKQRFDMIVCSSLLHEVEQPERLLNAIKMACHKETLIHINVPNANSLHRILAKESGLIKDVCQPSLRNKMFQQHNVFTLSALQEFVRDMGFEIVETGSYFVKPFTHAQMIKLLENDIIDEKILDGFYNIEKYMDGLGSEIFVNIKVKK